MSKKNRKKLRRKRVDEKLLQLLNVGEFRDRPFQVESLGENMGVVKESIWGWWKPRFLLNLNTMRTYEFMDADQRLLTVTQDDIDWDSLKGLSEVVIGRAKMLSFSFPSFIRSFKNGVAEVTWQLNPDGYYYMDEDGFGMTPDEEINIYGFIDQSAKVVVKFRQINNDKELAEMRKQAEKAVRTKQ